MGGPNAMNSIEDAVTGVRQVIASLTMEHTGRAWNFDGGIALVGSPRRSLSDSGGMRIYPLCEPIGQLMS